MNIKLGFRIMAIACMLAVTVMLGTISNVFAGGSEPGAGERWAGPAIEGTIIISMAEPNGSFDGTITFAGKCKNQACPEIGVVLNYVAQATADGLPDVAADLLYVEVDADSTETIPNIETCHTFVDSTGTSVPGDTVANVMRMGVNEVITFQKLDGPDADSIADRLVARVKLLFIVPDP